MQRLSSALTTTTHLLGTGIHKHYIVTIIITIFIVTEKILFLDEHEKDT